MKYIILLSGLIACLASLKAADDVELKAEKDAVLWSLRPDSNYGQEIWLFIQGGVGFEDRARSLLEFDLSQLPYAEEMVDEAFLRLWVLPDTEYIPGGHAGVFRSAEAWDESTVTWNNMPSEDRSTTRIEVLPPHPEIWFEVDITPIVYSWLYEDAENHGVFVEVPDGTPTAFPLFASREYGDTGKTPRLYIKYPSGVSEEDIPGEPISLQVVSVSNGKPDISFHLPRPMHVILKAYDASGALVDVLVQGMMPSGNNSISWTIEGSGVYFVRLETTAGNLCRRLVVR